MREDRFFLGILVGVGLLVVIAIIVYIARPRTVQYLEDGTASGAVQDYLTALYTRDYERAYNYVAEASDKVSLDIFRQETQNSLYPRIGQTTVEVGEAEVDANGETAVVPITIVQGGGFLQSANRSMQEVRLARQNGAWKITWAPDPFWVYGWVSELPTEPIIPTITETP